MIKISKSQFSQKYLQGYKNENKTKKFEIRHFDSSGDLIPIPTTTRREIHHFEFIGQWRHQLIVSDIKRLSRDQFNFCASEPFKRYTTKSLSHLITRPSIGINGRADVPPAPHTNFPRALLECHLMRAHPGARTSSLIRIHGYHFTPDLMSRIN